MYQQNSAHQQWLEQAITSLGGVAGTIHIPRDHFLHLTAAVHIPEPVLKVVACIPDGKGMAGLAQVRKQPVQTCDLQNDASGDVRPGAKAVNAQAAIAVPLLDTKGEVQAVIGIAWNTAGEITGEQQQQIYTRINEFSGHL